MIRAYDDYVRVFKEKKWACGLGLYVRFEDWLYSEIKNDIKDSLIVWHKTLEQIKKKCEQYWNEFHIEEPEVHAILEWIHTRATEIEKLLPKPPKE